MSPFDLSRTRPAGGGLLAPYSVSGSPVIKQLMQMVTMVPGRGGRFQSVCFPEQSEHSGAIVLIFVTDEELCRYICASFLSVEDGNLEGHIVVIVCSVRPWGTVSRLPGRTNFYIHCLSFPKLQFSWVVRGVNVLPAQSPGKPISWEAPVDLGNFLPVTESSWGNTPCGPDAELSQEPASCLFGLSVEMLFLLHGSFKYCLMPFKLVGLYGQVRNIWEAVFII